MINYWSCVFSSRGTRGLFCFIAQCPSCGGYAVHWDSHWRSPPKPFRRNSCYSASAHPTVTEKNRLFSCVWTYVQFIERSLEVKLPTTSTDGKAEVGRVREEKREEKRSEKRKSQRKEDAGARKVEKSRVTALFIFFPMICGSGGSKSRLARAAGVEPSGQMRDEKLHAAVARSTCRSQKY